MTILSIRYTSFDALFLELSPSSFTCNNADSRLNLVYGYSLLFASIRDHSFVAFDPPSFTLCFQICFLWSVRPTYGWHWSNLWMVSMVQQSVPVSSSVVFEIEAFVKWFHLGYKQCIALYGQISVKLLGYLKQSFLII